jgi:hypothetical protein
MVRHFRFSWIEEGLVRRHPETLLAIYLGCRYSCLLFVFGLLVMIPMIARLLVLTKFGCRVLCVTSEPKARLDRTTVLTLISV